TFRAFNPPHLDPTASYTLSLHDALPIWPPPPGLSATSANRREGREVSSPQALASRVDSSRLVRLAVKRWRWLQAKRATSRATRSALALSAALTITDMPFFGVSPSEKPEETETSMTPSPTLLWP